MSNDIWAKALVEAENSDLRDPGLWARCYAEADGDVNKAQAAYVKAKVGQSGVPVESPMPPPQKERGWCPVCHEAVDLGALYCTACKSNFAARGMYPLKYKPSSPAPSSYAHRAEEPEPKKSNFWKWLVGVPVGAFILLMAIGSCAGNSPEGQERSHSRSAIDLCWSEQAKKSNTPGDARFIAGACEKMENDYRSRWGTSP